jgi:tRNA pseudouridine32 synthase/23S rRNA pseudouridine746 synthase
MLHAARLSFPHPEGGTTTIEAPMPADMRELAEALGLAVPTPASL